MISVEDSVQICATGWRKLKYWKFVFKHMAKFDVECVLFKMSRVPISVEFFLDPSTKPINVFVILTLLKFQCVSER